MTSRFLQRWLGRAILGLSTLLASNATGQVVAPSPKLKAVVYYSINWELTSPERSFYRREASFDPVDMVFDGIYKDYNKDNRLLGEGSYVHGEKRGLQSEYFDDGKHKSTIEYVNNDFVIWELNTDSREPAVKGGTGKFSLYFLYVAGLVSQPVVKEGMVDGEFFRGRRAGKWIYSDLKKTIMDEEVYENGKMVRRIHYNEGRPEELNYQKEIMISVSSLMTDAYSYDHEVFHSLGEAFEKMVVYPADFNRGITSPGGIKKLLTMVSRTAEIPEGTVIGVTVKLDEKGHVVKYKVGKVGDKVMENRALESVKQMEGRFLPAIKNGIPKASSITLPLSGGDQWNEVLKEASLEDLTGADPEQHSKWGNVVGGILLVLLLVASML